MFGRNLTLFRVFGFEVRINISWAFLAILIAISLAQGYFPATYEGWPVTTYWWMAAAGVVGVFFSIVIHELSHSLAARAMGLQMKGITLFLFGGLAEMEREPRSAKSEAIMALAGPAISLVLGGLLLWVASLIESPEGATPMSAVIGYLGWLNFVLAIFNLIPAFPLDGGRALRAALWAIGDDLRWATKWASRAGAAFGLVLILGGVFHALTGAFIQGLWWMLIGMFVRAAAQASYQQMEMRRLMQGVRAEDVMRTCPQAVAAGMRVQDLVEHQVYELQQTEFPVCENGKLIGAVGVAQVKKVPRSEWGETSVGDIMVPVDQAQIIAPSDDVIDAIPRLQADEVNALIVAEDDRPLGLLAKSDIIKLISLKMELEAT